MSQDQEARDTSRVMFFADGVSGALHLLRRLDDEVIPDDEQSIAVDAMRRLAVAAHATCRDALWQLAEDLSNSEDRAEQLAAVGLRNALRLYGAYGEG